jgi:hypothetical protein
MTLAMAFFIFSGFGLTYLEPLAAGTAPPFPPIVHLHALFYFSWMLLLITQSVLINTSNVQLHRSLGTFGIVIAGVMLVLGSFVVVMFGRFARPNPMPDYYALMYLSVVALVSFATLFCLAIRNTRRPENHKRLMLFACINLLPPGVNRLYMVSAGITAAPVLATWLTLDALAIAMLVYDWRKLGKITTASLTGAAFVFVPQLLYPAIGNSVAFASFTRMLTDLAYYR